MPTDGFLERAALWGQAFEVAVKRGVLACLFDRELVRPDHPALAAWAPLRVSMVYQALQEGMEAVDAESMARVREATRHLLILGYGLGFTAMREYLRRLERPLATGKLVVRGLWCPLTIPGRARDYELDQELARQGFHELMGLPGAVDDALADKGQPANADFMLWLSGTFPEDHLLIQEYSYDMPAEIGDFRTEDAHLAELSRHARLLDSRGVFARVCAEVEQEHFALSSDLRAHLTALTSEDKPFFKLCQAAAYAESTLRLLAGKGLLTRPCLARALAITPNGFESLAARLSPDGEIDPRLELLRELGKAYRSARKGPEGDETWLTTEIEMVFKQLLRRLPRGLREAMRELRSQPAPGQDLRLEFSEEIAGFVNPAAEFPRADALAMVDQTTAIHTYLGRPAIEAVGSALEEIQPGAARVSLRDLHAGAVIAGLKAAQPGSLAVLGLEGNPGVGKTTAVMRYLHAADTGYLFLYVSPRVVINKDVTEKLARRDGRATGIMTVTTNAQLISAAERWHVAQAKGGKVERRKHIEGAVIVDGVPKLVDMDGSILLLTPEQEHELEVTITGSRLGKTTLSEHEDLVAERPLPGVLTTLATTTRKLLEANPAVDRVVITAATQGFREKSQGTTAEALSNVFANRANTSAGVRERRELAKRLPLVLAMIDEVAGDGAGAPFVHAVAEWLDREFIQPFDGASPFKVVLIVSDASLGNEVVLDRYLNAGERSPDKVLISRSDGDRCFRLAATDVRIGGFKRPTLHVMTNSFPARRLYVEYSVQLLAVQPTLGPDGKLESIRRTIRREAGEQFTENAVREVRKALEHGARQVILFAQDKQFLGILREALYGEKELKLRRGDVEILDSSVRPQRRKELVQPAERDQVKVFLMTSSGARGVSFPLCDWIVALVPRFNIEAALMEIAQLIYRGRGGRIDPDSGDFVSCDDLDRRLVLVVHDFLAADRQPDKRQWLKQAIDLLTLLTMLRATIRTRITGDAGIDGQPLALVPVGAVGTEEVLSLMSQHLREFLEEAQVYLYRNSDKDRGDLVGAAKRSVTELFSRFRLAGIARGMASALSFTRPRDLADLLRHVTLPLAGLLPSLDGELGRLPDHVSCSGPLWLESWRDFDKQEVFGFEGWSTAIEQLSRRAFSQLLAIDQDHEYPPSLRRPAASLFRLLAREREIAALEFSTIKELKSPYTWVAVPISYPQFVRQEGERDERVSVVAEPEDWRNALGRALNSAKETMPVIPRYDSFPWAVAVGPADPMRLDLTFDDRYFMASSELNLLNLLLMHGG